MKPYLKFDPSDIINISERYEYRFGDDQVLALKHEILRRGFLTKADLESVAYWKAPRTAHHALKNSDSYVSEVTWFIFLTSDERARIEALNLLDGVSWPTASVILHLFHSDPYPILDYRALWSLSLEQPTQYSFPFWWGYVEFCRGIAESANVDMRTLDKALWQYSKENQ